MKDTGHQACTSYFASTNITDKQHKERDIGRALCVSKLLNLAGDKCGACAAVIAICFVVMSYFFSPPVWPRPSRISFPLNRVGSLRCDAAFSPTFGDYPL